ncbi:hypothetical protein [Chitinophaga solisilvae]|uniref:Uncharacterized protein n=1 Tax=Chitinophaga solisilvae TaxID=1233460 RepID=A0A3S1B2K4_9BACT|nr:hypothetical protein [Chitinophaga solisilvae]NSL90984.1 hypothetical protein [Chitinophaga solisilvae]
MKSVYIIFGICLVAVILLLTKFLRQHSTVHGVKISVEETTATFKMHVRYNKNQTAIVENYIDSCFRPQTIFGGQHSIDKDIVTADSARFHINASAGYFSLAAARNNNSAAALENLVNICMKMKTVIKPE